MEYFAGLDVSMEETHICVVDRDGVVMHEATCDVRQRRACPARCVSTEPGAGQCVRTQRALVLYLH